MKTIIRASIALIILTLLCGIIYPMSITLIGQTLFAKKANGSILEVDEKEIGSQWIGQEFKSEKYFWSRPSKSDYQYAKANNQAVASKQYQEELQKRIEQMKQVHGQDKEVPLELVMYSASGLDPNIQVQSAYYQVERIQKARGIPKEKIEELIEKKVILEPWVGTKIVNVLELNIALDELESS